MDLLRMSISVLQNMQAASDTKGAGRIQRLSVGLSKLHLAMQTPRGKVKAVKLALADSYLRHWMTASGQLAPGPVAILCFASMACDAVRSAKISHQRPSRWQSPTCANDFVEKLCLWSVFSFFASIALLLICCECQFPLYQRMYTSDTCADSYLDSTLILH